MPRPLDRRPWRPLALALLAALPLWAGCGDGGGDTDGAPLEPLVPAAQKAYAVRLGRAALAAYFADGREAALAVGPGPAAGEAPVAVPRLFVTLRTDGVLRASRGAEDAPFADLVRRAVVQAVEDERYGGRLRADEVGRTVIELDAIFDPEPVAARDLGGLSAAIEAGRHAFEFTHADGSAFFTDTFMVTRGWTHERAFAELCREAGLGDRCWLSDDTAVVRFPAEHWLEAPDRPGGHDALFRTHRPVAPADVTPETVRAAARLAMGYLQAHQRPDGDFDYLYAPEQDALAPSQYTVRQAGACYFAARGATFFEEPELVETARACAAGLLAHEETNEAGVPYVDWQGTSLGLTALTLLALAELRPIEEFREAAYRLADGIVAQQQADGLFDVSYAGEDEPDAQQFFPGEALLALARLSVRYDDRRWLPAMEKAFTAYTAFWREQGKSAFVPWHAAAWGNVWRLTGERRYADFAFELADGLADRQDLSLYGDWRRDDWAGALFVPASGAPTAATGSSLEPLPLLVSVARALGDDERADRYADTVRHGLRFVLQLVITDRETFFMPRPDLSLGGVRFGLIDVHVRIDNVQHVGTAFLHALIETPADPVLWGGAAE